MLGFTRIVLCSFTTSSCKPLPSDSPASPGRQVWTRHPTVKTAARPSQLRGKFTQHFFPRVIDVGELGLKLWESDGSWRVSVVALNESYEIVAFVFLPAVTCVRCVEVLGLQWRCWRPRARCETNPVVCWIRGPSICGPEPTVRYLVRLLSSLCVSVGVWGAGTVRGGVRERELVYVCTL